MKQILHFDNVEIFDWYDGLVLGLARSQDSSFLVCLLAFDPDRRRKRYLLASISQEQTKRLRALFQDHGLQSFSKLTFSEIIAPSVSLYLTSAEPKQDKTVELTIMDSEQRLQLQGLSLLLIDEAVSPNAISQWLDN